MVINGTTLITTEDTDVVGAYQTGTVDTGNFSVAASLFGYETKTIEGVNLKTGEVTELDIELVALPSIQLESTVVDAVTGKSN